MSRGLFKLVLCGMVVLGFSPAILARAEPPAAAAAAATDGKYLGFTIDDSKVRDLANHAEVLKATQQQIDIVCAVGLPEEILTFFKTVPLVLVPPGTIPSGSPGVYGGKNRGVRVTAGIAKIGSKPILLHEYLHAYHDQRMEKGVRNPEILAFYERAKSISAYSARSHMMDNAGEFFTCSATTYLYGVTAQEPFKREKVKENQPDMFEHLKALFGLKAGSYTGTLPK